MNELTDLQERYVKFRDERDWEQFHTPKDLAISLLLEASEVLEHFQWRTPEEIKKYTQEHKTDISDELADVLSYVLLMAHALDIDLVKAAKEKLDKNEAKYPAHKARGNHKKYTELNA
jgi:NTP pyrophosphatase (non-canonical NTP hydrolase)